MDTSLTHIDFGGDLISFEVELACAPTLTPVNNGELRVHDPFADDFLSVNSSVRSRNDELLVDKFVSKTEVFFNHVCARLDQTEKSTSEGFDKMKTAMNEIQVVSAERFNQLEQKFNNKFIHLEQKFDNQFVHLEQKFDNQNEHFEQKFHSLTGQFDCLQQKFDRHTAKFDQFEKNTNDKFEQFQKSTDDKFDQFEISISREIDNKLEHIEATISDKIDTVISDKINDKLEQIEATISDKIDTVISDKINDKLEQIEVTFTEKIDTVISDKLESLISEKMQTEFNKFEEKVDLKFVNLRGELLQVDSKLNTLQLQLTDKMTTEMNKFQADIDNKFVHFNEELTDFKSTVTEQLDAISLVFLHRFKCHLSTLYSLLLYMCPLGLTWTKPCMQCHPFQLACPLSQPGWQDGVVVPGFINAGQTKQQPPVIQQHYIMLASMCPCIHGQHSGYIDTGCTCYMNTHTW